MDLEIITLSEISQTEKDKYHIISLIFLNLKYDTNEPTYETEIESQTREQACDCWGGAWG